MLLTPADLPRVIAHRGARAYAPENTMSAFKKAHALGATWIEFDVKLTACGELIVMHDHLLQRTTNGWGKVKTHTYEDIARLDAGSWFSSAFRGEPVPRLIEVLAFLRQTGMHANIEIKPCAGTATKISQAILACLAKYWQRDTHRVLLSSACINTLQIIRENDLNLSLALISDTWLREWQCHVQQLNLFSLHYYHKILTLKRLQWIGEHYPQLPVLAYTVNDQYRAQLLYQLGVCSVFTDYPDLII